jgi:release factor glutamine methyltransferase
MTTTTEFIDQAAKMLAAAGFEAPRLEARWLAAHAAGLAARSFISDAVALDSAAYRALVARRLAHEPLALITGTQGFWTLELAVSGDTLIPRADSETLIEAALASGVTPERILDLGTGTGCLLLASLTLFAGAFGVGVDLEPAACALAARNAAACGLADRAAFVAGDWGQALEGKFDLIFSNPPYIPTAALEKLQPEVVLHEPWRALDGGPDGFEKYRRLLPALPGLLAPGGLAIMEVGFDQADTVAELGRAAGLRHQTTRLDLGGVARAVIFAAVP